jgi:hypothetical protein
MSTHHSCQIITNSTCSSQPSREALKPKIHSLVWSLLPMHTKTQHPSYLVYHPHYIHDPTREPPMTSSQCHSTLSRTATPHYERPPLGCFPPFQTPFNTPQSSDFPTPFPTPRFIFSTQTLPQSHHLCVSLILHSLQTPKSLPCSYSAYTLYICPPIAYFSRPIMQPWLPPSVSSSPPFTFPGPRCLNRAITPSQHLQPPPTSPVHHLPSFLKVSCLLFSSSHIIPTLSVCLTSNTPLSSK